VPSLLYSDPDPVVATSWMSGEVRHRRRLPWCHGARGKTGRHRHAGERLQDH
jgi:hypothetical protein